ELSKLHDLPIVIDAEDTEIPLSNDVKALLFEAVYELLFNVTQHASVKEVTVRMYQDGQRLQIAVEGKGVRFEASAREENWKPLGLDPCRFGERLAALGGGMAIEPIPSEGTCIRLTAPLAPVGSAQAAVQATRFSPAARAAQTASTSAAQRPMRVLVVDDHAIMREEISNVLSGDERFVVIGEAADGVEAIKAVERRQPDVVLIDVNMPRMNGVEATREICRRWPEVRIVALSVQDDAATARTMTRAGAAAFVSKSDPRQMIRAMLAPIAKN
ncbi:MAG TPA: response regulator, partial [Nitrococcus sp.]|nr:response regulator [Nitrococcus sp.]